MIQTSAAVPAQKRPQPEPQIDPLWQLAGDMHNARALVIAEHGLDLICGLIQRGCPAATALRPGDKPDAGDYDIVFVPQATALPSSDHVIRLARRALRPDGRLIAGVSDGKAAAALGRRLRLNGFSNLHSRHRPGLVLLSADLRRPA
jgi:hypothetical protein